MAGVGLIQSGCQNPLGYHSAPRDVMIRQLFEFGGPEWVDRLEFLIIATDPALQKVARLALGHHDSIVEAG